MMILDSLATNIFVLRHGQSEANLQHLVCGQRDFPLTNLGRLQAEKVCKKLSKIEFNKVYSSPLSRALQTIEPLGIRDIILVSEIMEVDTGIYSDLTVEELYALDSRYKYQGIYPDLSYPNGESLNSMIHRASTWFNNEKNKWSLGQNILITGHEGTLCALLHDQLGMDIKQYPSFRIPNCSYIVMSINDDQQIRVQFFNME